MDQDLTPEQLYRDLVDAHTRPAIPSGAFTVKQFAADADLGRDAAQEALLVLLEAGQLERVSDGKRYWYYFKTRELKENG